MHLLESVAIKALDLGIPLNVQLDLTYRCNETCVHCYLDHEDHGEMTTAEFIDILDQLAAAGTLFLTISGGEVFMRTDLFEILEHARKLNFSVKLKTNAVMIKPARARRLAELGIAEVSISLYSHDAATHDAITQLPDSHRHTMEGIANLKAAGLRVRVANVLMQHNADDYKKVKELAKEMGVEYSVDATITPMMDGDRSILALNVNEEKLAEVMHDPALLGDKFDEMTAPPKGPKSLEEAYQTLPCSAGHTACYISPYGDVYPCVQFPFKVGNVREQRFIDIWKDSPQLAEVRSIRISDLDGCSKCVHSSDCSRCPGLAYMEGNMRGPSTQDCEKSYARTGVMSWHLKKKKRKIPIAVV